MKADDSYTEYSFNFIKYISDKFGPRYSSSEAEKKANLWIKDEFANYCDETHIEEFSTNPNLYPMGIFKITGFFVGISFIFMPLAFPLPLLSAVFIIIGLFVLISELFFMKRWIKFLFKKGESSNVWGVIKPIKEPKFRLIFEGHTDSAKQMRMAEYEGKPPILRFLLGFVYIFFTLIMSIVKIFAQLFNGTSIIQYSWSIFQWTLIDWFYFIPFIILFPFFVFLVKGFTGKIVVHGANDNLSGSAVSAAVGKYLSEHRPKNLEIVIGSMGSEEIGDRGAKYFVEKHGDLLKDSYAFVVDSVGAGDHVYIVEKDFMHRTRYSSEVVSRIEKAYELYKKENSSAISCNKGGIPLGSSDACMYSKAGYKSAFIIVVSSTLKKPSYWHSIKDIPENINKNVLKDIIGICLKFVEIVDAEVEHLPPLA